MTDSFWHKLVAAIALGTFLGIALCASVVMFCAGIIELIIDLGSR